MVTIERLDSGDSSSSDGSDSEAGESSNGVGVDEKEQLRIRRRVELQPDSETEESDSEEEEDEDDEDDDSSVDEEEEEEDDYGIFKGRCDDKWSDEEEEEEEAQRVDSDGSSESEDHKDETQCLSLKERLSRQEAKQSTMRTITSLKDQRERRSKAASIAKDRLKKALKPTESREVEVEEGEEDQEEDDIVSADKKKKKKSKHAPTEVSSRRRHNKTLNESGIGIQIGSNRYQPRDPRMSSLSGHWNADQHDHHYAFLEEAQNKEIGTLKRKLKAHKITGQKGQRERRKLGMTDQESPEFLQERLQKLQQITALHNQQKLERRAKKAVKQKLQQRVKDGMGGAYFPKRSEMRKLQMEAKVEEIEKNKGHSGLNKYLAKRRKKQKSQHAKKMRSGPGGGFFGGAPERFG